jgi:hypothetical protein
MIQLPELPDIQIVEIIQALQTQGFLKNPPAVLRIEAETERYVVLDGANRTNAAREMGFPHMLVQIANKGVEVRSWNHILSGGDLRRLQKEIQRINGVDVGTTDEFRAAAALAREESLAYIVLPDGETWQLEVDEFPVSEKIRCLTEFVGLYEGRFLRERTSTSNLNGLASFYPNMNALIVFPQFNVDDVVEIASGGKLFPSGLTRFLISPRALRINFPLAMLADRSSIDEKRRALAEWIRQRLEQRRVRYYAESTFVFDE